MSISNAFSAAISGLNANSRAASVVSENVANAGTEGYGLREISLSAITYGSGQGVRVNGVGRFVDPVLLAGRREAGATLAAAQTRSEALLSLENLIGVPSAADSIPAELNAFEASLVAAISRPDSESRLRAVLQNADKLATSINAASRGIQAVRKSADHDIGIAVERLNQNLAEIHKTNVAIRTAVSRGESALGLMDQQQKMIDEISGLVPIRERRNEAGMVSLFTHDGLALLDGSPATFGFDAIPAISAGMTLASGDLSGLTVNGRPVRTDGAYSSMRGGDLAAMFEVRDKIAVGAQARLDGLALDLAARFDAPSVDGTRLATDPGLFTDSGALVDATQELGLAGRLRINAQVDPAQGGALWRLRDGVGAVAEGEAGDPALLQNLLDALQAKQSPASSVYSSTNRSMSDLSSDLLSITAIDRQFADTEVTRGTATFNALKEAELRGGVDTDAQLQQLMEIEKSYAANARVINALDEMISLIMGLGR